MPEKRILYSALDTANTFTKFIDISKQYFLIIKFNYSSYRIYRCLLLWQSVLYWRWKIMVVSLDKLFKDCNGEVAPGAH